MVIIEHENSFHRHAINKGITNKRFHSEKECCEKNESNHATKCNNAPFLVSDNVQIVRQSSNDTLKTEVRGTTEEPESEKVTRKLQYNEAQNKGEGLRKKMNGQLQGGGSQQKGDPRSEEVCQYHSGMTENFFDSKTEKCTSPNPTKGTVEIKRTRKN
jgi:hypothetical protein